MTEPTYDATWDAIYQSGHTVRYPWDAVVTFVLRNAPRDRPRCDVRILEVGCGSGSNLWFAAREGFSVAGIDGSVDAISQARHRFLADGLHGDLRVGDFTRLDGFDDGSFDLVIDRGALVCSGRSAATRAVAGIHRVLKPQGRFFFNPYSKRHTSASAGRPVADGLRIGIDHGSLVGVGQLCFYDRADIGAVLGSNWRLLSVEHVESVNEVDDCVHAEWRVIAGRV